LLRSQYTKKIFDYVAKKSNRLLYIQTSYLLLNEQVIRREYALLEAISDNYEKIVVSLDDVVLPSNEGIGHIQAWRLAD
jgi:predicted AAA+ superfamily ATPase